MTKSTRLEKRSKLLLKPLKQKLLLLFKHLQDKRFMILLTKHLLKLQLFIMKPRRSR
ncbi:MAG: hypothetical protein JSY10_09100 [Paenibacillus sp.]|nr:hypothetical protein [Paenibacillus sp.]